MIKPNHLQAKIIEILAGGYPKSVREMLPDLEKIIQGEVAFKNRVKKTVSCDLYDGRPDRVHRPKSIMERTIAGKVQMVGKALSGLQSRRKIGSTGRGIDRVVWILRDSISEQEVIDRRVEEYLSSRVLN